MFAYLNVCNVHNVHQNCQHNVHNDVQQRSILLVLSEVKRQDRQIQFHVSSPRVFSVLCKARTSKSVRVIFPVEWILRPHPYSAFFSRTYESTCIAKTIVAMMPFCFTFVTTIWRRKPVLSRTLNCQKCDKSL